MLFMMLIIMTTTDSRGAVALACEDQVDSCRTMACEDLVDSWCEDLVDSCWNEAGNKTKAKLF